MPNEPTDKVLGVVVGGSLSKGLEVKLDRDTSTEETAVGRYVVVQGQSRRFFSMITDVMLDATDPALGQDRAGYERRLHARRDDRHQHVRPAARLADVDAGRRRDRDQAR